MTQRVGDGMRDGIRIPRGHSSIVLWENDTMKVPPACAWIHRHAQRIVSAQDVHMRVPTLCIVARSVFFGFVALVQPLDVLFKPLRQVLRLVAKALEVLSKKRGCNYYAVCLQTSPTGVLLPQSSILRECFRCDGCLTEFQGLATHSQIC